MKKSKGLKAIERVAIQNGVSVEEVRKEIECAINAGMSNPDPTARAFWDKYIKSGRKPSAEEFIVYMAEKTKSENKT